ncbi:hypothetical protein [Cohnella sp. GCM10012308]|uniref:hypothetical protein n=1 Tax=Cohnella sp. GCM10012308 TaxID=3317329 RepID=UPI00361A11B8
MNMNKRIREYIIANGLTFSLVAELSGYDIKKFSRWMTNSQPMSTDDYEKVCSLGLKLDPSYFYSKKFLETQNSHSA